nr:MAG TPA: hypothetical protein [Caudoviricetes sp.]
MGVSPPYIEYVQRGVTVLQSQFSMMHRKNSVTPGVLRRCFGVTKVS